jgi:hypothetical protein
VRVLLAERCGSARDLAGMLRWRIQRALNYARRRTTLQVDTEGDLYAVKAQARADLAKAAHEASADIRAGLRARLEAAQARKRAERSERTAAAWPSVTRPGTAAALPAEPVAAGPAAPSVDPVAVLDPATLALLGQAQANARTAYGVREHRQPPPVADVLGAGTD